MILLVVRSIFADFWSFPKNFEMFSVCPVYVKNSKTDKTDIVLRAGANFAKRLTEIFSTIYTNARTFNSYKMSVMGFLNAIKE